MMDAIVVAKLQEDQKAQIENRIIRLKKDEERAMKRIKDLQRRQKFVQEMNMEKTNRRDTMQDMWNNRKNTENNNRSKFNCDRV